MLSKENYDTLNENYLYEKKPLTYFAAKQRGEAFMFDTYGNNKGIQVTDDNIDEFKFIFDFREVEQLPDSEVDEYDKKDLYFIAYENYDQAYTYWKNKGVQKSLDLQIVKAKNRVENAKMQLEWTKNNLKNLYDIDDCNATENARRLFQSEV